MTSGHSQVSETDRLVGRRLRQERVLAGQSSEILARALRVSPQTLLDYESGSRRMAPQQLVAASAALDLPMSLLLYDTDAAEDLGADRAGARRWMALPRPLSLLSRPAFASFRALAELWRASHGALPEQLAHRLVEAGLLHRMILARHVPGSVRFEVEHMGYGIEVFRPCESLLMTGRDISEQHDGDYGAWVADAYGATLAASRPTFQSVRAQINVTAGQAVEGRYDRLLLPWRGARGERYVMGVSVTRAHRRFAGPPPGLAAAAV